MALMHALVACCLCLALLSGAMAARDLRGQVFNTPMTFQPEERVVAMPNFDQVKDQWPEVVGRSFEEAKFVILADKPSANVQEIRQGVFVTLDFRQNRVRVSVDDNGIVVRPPRIG